MAPKKQDKQKTAANAADASKKPVAGSIKAANQKKKSTFRPILENPFTNASWPEISAENGKLCIKLLKNAIDTQLSLAKGGAGGDSLGKSDISSPGGRSSLVYGLNAVTDSLEAQAQIVYQRVNQSASTSDSRSNCRDSQGSEIVYRNPICAVFVCRSDFSFPLLLAHLPLLCSAASYYPGRTSDMKDASRVLDWGDYMQTVKLIQLPSGAMEEITASIPEQGSGRNKRKRQTSLCKSSFGILALRRESAGAKHLLDLVCLDNKMVPAIEVPWLDDFKKVALSELPCNKHLKLSQPNVKFVGSETSRQPAKKRKERSS